MSKAVVLNSGGFDSVVLLHYLKRIQGENDLHSLHFLYGAKNEKQQLSRVDKVCKDLNIPNKVISLPKIDWSSHQFFEDNDHSYENNYLEYRNLIFLSYALSYAEAIKADKVYIALLNHNIYPDTTIDFLRGINSFSEINGISVDAPFIFDNKTRLGHIASYLGLNSSDYFSCDYPKEGNPCGVCPDCVALEEIRNILNKNI